MGALDPLHTLWDPSPHCVPLGVLDPLHTPCNPSPDCVPLGILLTPACRLRSLTQLHTFWDPSPPCMPLGIPLLFHTHSFTCIQLLATVAASQVLAGRCCGSVSPCGWSSFMLTCNFSRENSGELAACLGSAYFQHSPGSVNYRRKRIIAKIL